MAEHAIPTCDCHRRVFVRTAARVGFSHVKLEKQETTVLENELPKDNTKFPFSLTFVRSILWTTLGPYEGVYAPTSLYNNLPLIPQEYDSLNLHSCIFLSDGTKVQLRNYGSAYEVEIDKRNSFLKEPYVTLYYAECELHRTSTINTLVNGAPVLPRQGVPRPALFQPKVPQPKVRQREVPRPALFQPKVPQPKVRQSEVPRPEVPRPDVLGVEVPRPEVPATVAAGRVRGPKEPLSKKRKRESGSPAQSRREIDYEEVGRKVCGFLEFLSTLLE